MGWFSKFKKKVKAGIRTLGRNAQAGRRTLGKHVGKANRARNQLNRNLRRVTPTKQNLQDLRSNIVKGAKEAKGKVNEIGNNFEDSYKQITGMQDIPTKKIYAKPSGSGSPTSASSFDAETVDEDKYNADGSLKTGSLSSLRIKRKKKRSTDTDFTGSNQDTSSGLTIKKGGLRS